MIRPFSEKIPYAKTGETKKRETISVVRNFTLEPHFDATVEYYAPEVGIGYYYLDDSIRNRIRFDNDVFVMLHLPYLMEDVYSRFYQSDEKDREEYVRQKTDFVISQIKSLLNQNNRHHTYISLFVSPDIDTAISGEDSFDTVAAAINRELVQMATANKNITLINTVTIARQIGTAHYFSKIGIYTTDSVLSRDAINRICHELISKRVQQVHPVKCLVLDCDNVLWGGILDEVGSDGIALSNNGIGRTYYEFQREILKLKSQGFLICICSRNDESTVKYIFDNHPHMLIRWNDLCGHKVSFDAKSQNIRKLSMVLNMPTEEMLFVDDNPFEVQEVAASLTIRTLLLDPRQPHTFSKRLYDSGWCYKDFVSPADRHRTEQYRSTLFSTFANVPAEEINGMLSTEIEIRRATRADFQRIAELSCRTHQFNMSGIRYDVNDLDEMLASSDYFLYVLTARDKFGDLGIVAAAVANRKIETLTIESLFVSCRILGRELEVKFLNYIRNEHGNIATEGFLKSTGNNEHYKDFYALNGVTPITMP